MQNGIGPDGGGRRPAPGARHRRPARRRCVDHADPHLGQHQRAIDHDRRKGVADDAGGRRLAEFRFRPSTKETPPMAQADKAKQFRALHDAPGAFVIANVWDGGSARMMAGLGFAAPATSSGASAGLLGRRDGKVTRDEALAQARVICDATDLPVSADLEKAFGDTPEIVAETIRLAAETGLVGCSIEDASGNPDTPIFELGYAIERIAAA